MAGPGGAPIRPRRLRVGDTVAVVSPSWGGPAVFPHVFERGLATLRAWGLGVREYPGTRARRDDAARSPQGRAADLNAAFADPSVAAVIASIGGDDAIRLLPFLDAAAIRANPKLLMGFSDTTVLLAAIRAMGLVTFHGPSVMAGLSQLGALPAMAGDHVRRMLFEPAERLVLPRFDAWTDGYPDWSDPALVGQVWPLRSDDGPRVLQGDGTVRGELFGGCLEVLDWIRGTSAWPVGADWDGRLLLLEPSEEQPGEDQWRRILRSLGASGVFDRVAGVLLGRMRGLDAAAKQAMGSVVLDVIAGELGRSDLPVVANLPFGHTDPQWVLPLGIQAEVDLATADVTLVEPWLV